MLDGMSVELAEKVHLLFMVNYIDYSDYDFRDDGQVESYCWSYLHITDGLVHHSHQPVVVFIPQMQP